MTEPIENLERPKIIITEERRIPINLTPYIPGLNAPTSIGKGGFKWVWVVHPEDKLAIINAKKQNIQNIALFNQVKEFYYTLILGEAMPELIPKVYLIDPNFYFFRDNRFRYFKERVDTLPKSNKTFREMVALIDTCIKHGFSYVDIKPANLGYLNGKLVMIDTDPEFFYKIPLRFRRYFWIANLMTAVGFCYRFDVCDKEILREFIRDTLTMEMIEEVLKVPDLKKYEKYIIEESLDLFEKCSAEASEYLKQPIHTEKHKIHLPFESCAWYSLENYKKLKNPERVVALRALFLEIREWGLPKNDSKVGKNEATEPYSSKVIKNEATEPYSSKNKSRSHKRLKTSRNHKILKTSRSRSRSRSRNKS